MPILKSHRAVARALVAALLLALALAGCSWLPEVKDETAGWSADRLYHDRARRDAAGQLYAGDQALRVARGALSRTAATRSRRSSSPRSPTGAPNEQAAAIAACDRFIRTYPNHPERRLRVLPEGPRPFPRGPGHPGLRVRARPRPSATRRRCARRSRRSRSSTTRFPESQYYQDSIARMRYLNNAIGTYEVNVARYYYKRGAYIAAANRAQGALLNFPQTPSNERGARRPARRATRSWAWRSSPTIRGRSSPRRSRKASTSTGVTDKPWWQFWSPQDTTLRRAGHRRARDQAVVAVLGFDAVAPADAP